MQRSSQVIQRPFQVDTEAFTTHSFVSSHSTATNELCTGSTEIGKVLRQTTTNNELCIGSTEIGKVLRQATAGTGKKISLELGGKSPVIVFHNADLDSAGRVSQRAGLLKITINFFYHMSATVSEIIGVLEVTSSKKQTNNMETLTFSAMRVK